MESGSYDGSRTAWLESQDFRVIRFWNNQVLGEIEGVREAILIAVQGSAPLSPPS